MSVLYYLFLGEVTLVAPATDGRLRIAEGAGDDGDADIAAGTYFLRGDGTSDDLCKALKDALEAAIGTANTYSVTPVFTVAPSVPIATVSIARATGSATFILRWANAGSTLDQAAFGFADADTANDAATKVSTLTPSSIWAGNEPPSHDDPLPEALGAQVRTRGGQVRTFDLGGPFLVRALELELITAERTLQEAIPADLARSYEKWWSRHRDGRRFEVHRLTVSGTTLQAPTSSTRLGTFVLDEASCAAPRPRRTSPGMPRYGWPLGLRGYVA